MHSTDVDDDQDEEPQLERPCVAVEEYSKCLKLRPATVTEPKPECGLFALTNETAGASKEKMEKPVPTDAPTVRSTVLGSKTAVLVKQATELEELHNDVKHNADETEDVAVYSTYRKFNPETVTEKSPVCGPFRQISETTGASKVKI